MAEIAAFFEKYFPLMRTILAAIAGLWLMLFGLGTFRRLYAPMCAALGLATGLILHSAFPRDEMFIVAVMIAIACGVIGYENYKCGLVLVSSLSSLIAGVSFVVRRAHEDILLGISGAVPAFKTTPERYSVLRLWFYRHKYEGDMKEALLRVYKDEDHFMLNSLKKMFEDTTDALQISLGIVLIIAVFAGLLSFILADYIVIASTTALGSIMLVGIIEETEFLRQIEYNYKLIIFFIGGMVFQIARYYKSIESERQKKKRRGLYDKVKK